MFPSNLMLSVLIVNSCNKMSQTELDVHTP